MKQQRPTPRSVPYDLTQHTVSNFDCGNESLNTWIVRDAHHARQMGTANTYVFSRGGSVIAYYSLAAHQVQSAELPNRIGRGSPLAIPAYLIGKLAVHQEVQGQGIGHALLTDALLRLVRATESGAGARIVAVDAVNKSAMQFYRNNHFVSVPGNELQMYMKMSTARRIVTPG